MTNQGGSAMRMVEDEVRGTIKTTDAVRLAERLGCTVTKPRRTGELRFAHPSVPSSVRMNGRRKDASRAVKRFLSQVAARKATRSLASACARNVVGSSGVDGGGGRSASAHGNPCATYGVREGLANDDTTRYDAVLAKAPYTEGQSRFRGRGGIGPEPD